MTNCQYFKRLIRTSDKSGFVSAGKRPPIRKCPGINELRSLGSEDLRQRGESSNRLQFLCVGSHIARKIIENHQ